MDNLGVFKLPTDLKSYISAEYREQSYDLPGNVPAKRFVLFANKID